MILTLIESEKSMNSIIKLSKILLSKKACFKFMFCIIYTGDLYIFLNFNNSMHIFLIAMGYLYFGKIY